MKNMFQENLKILAKKYSQKKIAEKTGFSQSSINNYLSKVSEPSIQFLVALKDAYGINVDDFLFSQFEEEINVSYDRFLGNYIIYYYNNNSYKGEVHTNLKSTLNYGVISVYKYRELDKDVKVVASFMKDRVSATKMLKILNATKNAEEIDEIFNKTGNVYTGNISCNEQNIFIELANNENEDQTFIIFNNPPTKSEYFGGVGTVNSIARGREHNPCVQFIIMSKKLLDVPDGELYKYLMFDKINVNLDDCVEDIIALFKRLYVQENEISIELTEGQKQAIVRNKLEYHFNEIIQANVFRFAKISNKEDDAIYNLIREGNDVG